MLPAKRNVAARREDPFESVRHELDRLSANFDRMWSDWQMPSLFANGEMGVSYPVDMHEDENAVYVDAEMPGFQKGDIEVNLLDGGLSISAERKEEKKKNGKQHLHERRYMSVQRQLWLPAEVDEKQIKAELKDGVLHVTLPKTVEAKKKQPHKVSVS